MKNLHRELKRLTAAGAILVALAGALYAGGTGTVDRASGWYPAGTNLTVTATPSIYSVFDRWTGDTNGSSIAGAQISFIVSDTRSVTAVFKDRLTMTNSVPYWWLAGQGITTNFEAAVTADPDSDNFTTAEEYWSGTDPQSGSSYLRIDALQNSGANYELVWSHSRVDPAIPPISIQMRSSLATGDWVNVDSKMPVDGVNTWSTNAPLGYFFRLCVTNMP